MHDVGVSHPPADSPLERLTRWERFGGSWRVLARDDSGLTISLRRCDGGEEVERIVSADSALVAFVGNRLTNEQTPAG